MTAFSVCNFRRCPKLGLCLGSSQPPDADRLRHCPAFTNDYSYWSEQVKSSTRVLYESDPAGQRGVVQRIEVQSGDTNVFGSGTGERAEVTAHAVLGGFMDGQTMVLSWSTLIDSGFESPREVEQLRANPRCRWCSTSPWQLNLAGLTRISRCACMAAATGLVSHPWRVR